MKAITDNLRWSGLLALVGLLVGCLVTPPLDPANLRLTSKSQTVVNLAWDASSSANTYVLERKTALGSFTQIASATLFTYSDTGLTPNTTYMYRIRAVNGGGASSGRELTVSTDPVAVAKIGLVELWENTQNQAIGRNAIGLFYSLATPLTNAPTNQFGIPADECRFFAQLSTPKFVDLSPGGSDRVALQVGDSPTMATPSGVYATLERQLNPPPFLTDYYGSLIYAHGASPLGNLPASAQVTVPGITGGFPAFNTAMPTPPNDFVLSASSGLDAITANSTLAWTGVASVGSLFYVEGQRTAHAGTTLYFRCALTDDGNFGFSAQQKTSLPDTYKITLARRVVNRTEVRGDSALLLSIGYFKNY